VGLSTGVPHIRKRTSLGSYSGPVHGVLGKFQGGGHFIMGEVPLHNNTMDLEEGAAPREVHVAIGLR